MSPRLYPITPRNSLVNGGDSRRAWVAIEGNHWRNRYNGELLCFDLHCWVDPGPSPAGNTGPYLKAPVLDGDGSDDGKIYRVYPRNERGNPVKREDGVWCWRYRP